MRMFSQQLAANVGKIRESSVCIPSKSGPECYRVRPVQAGQSFITCALASRRNRTRGEAEQPVTRIYGAHARHLDGCPFHLTVIKWRYVEFTL